MWRLGTSQTYGIQHQDLHRISCSIVLRGLSSICCTARLGHTAQHTLCSCSITAKYTVVRLLQAYISLSVCNIYNQICSKRRIYLYWVQWQWLVIFYQPRHNSQQLRNSTPTRRILLEKEENKLSCEPTVRRERSLHFALEFVAKHSNLVLFFFLNT